jgi:putative membrane protein
MMFGYGRDWAFWQVALMWVGMIASWAFVTWAVYAVVTAATRRPSEPPQSSDRDARRILDERLARGEIDIEEFRRLLDVLSSTDRQTPVGSPP